MYLSSLHHFAWSEDRHATQAGDTDSRPCLSIKKKRTYLFGFDFNSVVWRSRVHLVGLLRVRRRTYPRPIHWFWPSLRKEFLLITYLSVTSRPLDKTQPQLLNFGQKELVLVRCYLRSPPITRKAYTTENDMLVSWKCWYVSERYGDDYWFVHSSHILLSSGITGHLTQKQSKTVRFLQYP